MINFKHLALVGATGLLLGFAPGASMAAPMDTARSIADTASVPMAFAQRGVENSVGGFQGGGGGFRGNGGFRGPRGGGFRGGYGGGRGYYGRGGYGRGYYGRGRGYGYGRRWGYGPGVGLGVGLAAGALVGGALAAQAAEPQVVYGDDLATGSVTQSDIAACQAQFKSYDVASQSYLGFDGQRHSCPAE